MCFINKCKLSREKDKRCFFAENINNKTHCSLIIEWWPDDTSIENLDSCMFHMFERERLIFRNKMAKKKKYLEQKNKNT